jgi:glycosyltransferase involved in cell wall biosynthesis
MQTVSVIIPTYNSRDSITDAIESADRQSYDNIEIIVVDDGSTDDTVAVAREFLQRRARKWKVLTLERNKGPSAARNAGCRAASGSWFQFLDSDDLLMAGKIEREMSLAARAPDNVAVIYSPWNWGFLDSGSIEWFAGPLQQSSVSDRHPIMCLVGGSRPLLGSSLVRRQALEQAGGFDEQLRFWECEEMNVRLARVGTFLPAPSDAPQYLWRLRRGEVYIGGAGARYNSAEVAFTWIKQALKAADNRPLDELGLTEHDKALLLVECTLWGRLAYSKSRGAFREYLRLAQRLVPHMAPAFPPHITTLARWIGYENAEAVAKLARQPRAYLRSALRRAGLRKSTVIIELG